MFRGGFLKISLYAGTSRRKSAYVGTSIKLLLVVNLIIFHEQKFIACLPLDLLLFRDEGKGTCDLLRTFVT